MARLIEYSRIKILIVVLFIAKYPLAFSQNVDQEFKPVIKGFPYVNAIYLYPGGEAILGGNIFSVDKSPSASVLKLKSDGSLDTTFQTSIYAVTPGRIKAITVDNQEKILVGASQLKIDGTNYIVRLNPDGSIDDTFSNEGKLESIKKIQTLSDDKYLVSSGTLVASAGLNRLNSDGSIDETFNAYEEPYGRYTGAFKVLEDGKYLCAIHYTSIDFGVSIAKLVRLNTDGSLDDTFEAGDCDDGLGSESYIYDVELQSDGKIIVAGVFNYYNGQGVSNIIRLNSDGSMDTDFISPNPIGDVINIGQNIDLEILENDKIVIAGGSLGAAISYKVARLNKDGSTDDSFDIASFNITEAEYNPIIGKDTSETIYVAGNHTDYEGTKCYGIAALDTTGSIIKSYMPLFGGKPILNSVYQQADGKIIIGGEFTQIDTIYVNNLARFNKDGSVDTTFLNNIGVGPDAPVKYISCQSDNNIIIGGDFLEVNEINTGLLARLDSAGNVDQSFNAYVNQKYMYEGINKILVIEDDNIIIGGVFDVVNSQTRMGLAFLNSDGSLLALNADTMLMDKEYMVYDMDYQSDGKLLVGGRVINDIDEYGFLYRIDKDGVIDDTFTNSVSDINVSAVKVLDNDSIIVGNYTWGNENSYIKQLDIDGNMVDDSSIYVFQKEEGYPEVNDIQYPGDGQLIIGGRFTSVNGIEKPALIKVSLDGNVDEHFKYDVEGTIKQFFQEDSTHLFVVGDFNRIGNDYDLFCIARIDINFPDSPTDLVEDSTSEKSLNSSGIKFRWTDHSYNETGFSIERSLDNKSFESIATVNSNIYQYTDVGIDTSFTYYYRVKAFNISGGSNYSNVAKLKYSSGGINLTNTTNINKPEKVLAVPNPGNGKFYIILEGQKILNTEIAVFNISGNCVYKKLVEDNTQIPIDISNEPAGIYIVRIYSNNINTAVKYILK